MKAKKKRRAKITPEVVGGPLMRPIRSDAGELMTLEEFNQACTSGCFIDYDGTGELATATHVSSVRIWPSVRKLIDIPAWATHVLWYNR